MNSAIPAAVARGPDLSAARIKRRYAAERRFRSYGLLAISLAILMLVVLLGKATARSTRRISRSTSISTHRSSIPRAPRAAT
jgi:hypothetical protein